MASWAMLTTTGMGMKNSAAARAGSGQMGRGGASGDSAAPFPAKVSRRAMRNTATLDRIDNDIGYVVGNVAVISYRANTMKNDATLEEINGLARWREAARKDKAA